MFLLSGHKEVFLGISGDLLIKKINNNVITSSLRIFSSLFLLSTMKYNQLHVIITVSAMLSQSPKMKI